MNKLIAGALCALVASTANAAPTYFYGIDPSAGPGAAKPVSTAAATSFAAAAGTLSGPITFESQATGYSSSNSLGNGVIAAFSGDVDTAGSGILANDGETISGFNTTSGGTKFLRLESNLQGNRATSTSIAFTFAAPISAFGTYVTGLGTAAGAITVGFNDGTNQSYALTGSSTTGTLFFGVTDTAAFSSITFTETIPSGASSRDNFGLDDIVYHVAATSAAPEPASWAMMIAGFGAVGTTMRRRKVNTSFA